MKITTKIFKETAETTLSKLYINDVFECYILEDEFNKVKIKGDTRIPRGTYNISLKKYGGFYEKYVKNWKSWVKKFFPSKEMEYLPNFEGSLKLNDVPNFSEILIHIGNTEKDTEGCLLVGSGYTLSKTHITITDSTLAFVKLYNKVAKAINNGEKVTITLQ